MLRFARVEVGDGRPRGCARCAQPAHASYRPLAEVARAIDGLAAGWSDAPGPNIVLTGPEPFAHPELPGLVAACVRSGVQRIAVETDGSALAVDDNASGLLSAGVRHLLVRVLAADAATGDACGERPRLVQAARTGIAAYLAAASEAGHTVAVTAVIPVCRHNVHALPASVASIATWGVHGVRLVSADQMPANGMALVQAACDTGMVNRLWVEASGFSLPASHSLHEVPDAASGGREVKPGE
jgi:molybdenum cofactor biosynthesis enzyme MoaA